MDNVSEVLTHKAMGTISSYRQKMGRAGESRGQMRSHAPLPARTSSQVNDKAGGQPHHPDPVPVATNNLAVLKHRPHESVFDFLAYKGHRIEQIPKMAQQDTGSQATRNGCD